MNNQHLSKYLTLAPIFLTTIFYGCNPSSTDEIQKKTQENIGMDASITASFIFSASKSCQVIGIDDINTCSRVEGILPEERSAKMLADMAIDQAAKYQKNCQLNYTAEYCTQLANRAIDIAWNKSKITEQEE